MKELKIKALVDNLHKVNEWVDEELEQLDCPIKIQMQIDIAVEEIFVNIANYAYTPNTGEACINMEYCKEGNLVKITFIDSGVPYNPLAKEDPDVTLSGDERPIGGLGIFMVKKSMDEMLYDYKDGQNVLTLIKKLG